MKNNPVLFKWWIQSVVTVFAAVIAGHLGWWEALWDADQTKISILIILLFVLSTLGAGYISKVNTQEVLEKYQNYIWFASEAMITLGMIGTVAGFLILLGNGFESIDVTDTKSLQNIIAGMAVGMSTALTTTLVGLISSVLTKLQMVIIENSWEDDEEVQK